MTTPAFDTKRVAEVCIPINETGTFLGASSDGTSQSSNTISHAQVLEAEVSEYSKIIAQLPTNNSPVVGLGLALSTVPEASDPTDRDVSHHSLFHSHLADEHSCDKLAELQTQTQSHPGLGETHTASTVISAHTVTTSSDNTDNVDTRPTSLNEDVAFEDFKSEGSATDKACYGADSDRSNHSESSDRSSSGSPDPTTSTPNDKLAGLAGWDGSVPEKEEESGIASQLPRLRYPKDVVIGIPETPNHAQERKNAAPHAEPASASSYTVDLEAATPSASSHNGLRQASSPKVTVEVQHELERESHFVKLFKRIVTVVGLVAALALGIVAYTYKQDLLLACTIVIMIASVDAMIQDF